MASVEDCEQALNALAAKTQSANPDGRRDLSRTLSCTIRDLEVSFGGALRHGELVDIKQVDDAAADIRLEMTSDDLVDLVAGRLRVATAWATGRIKVQAGMRDLMRLRSMF